MKQIICGTYGELKGSLCCIQFLTHFGCTHLLPITDDSTLSARRSSLLLGFSITNVLSSCCCIDGACILVDIIYQEYNIDPNLTVNPIQNTTSTIRRFPNLRHIYLILDIVFPFLCMNLSLYDDERGDLLCWLDWPLLILFLIPLFSFGVDFIAPPLFLGDGSLSFGTFALLRVVLFALPFMLIKALSAVIFGGLLPKVDTW